MPWKECSVMDERLRFVARLLEGEAMSDVCREFGVSRKTGYKIFDRYKQQGPVALADRSRRPVRYANQLPPQIKGLVVRSKREKPHWGARKIRELLVRKLDGEYRIPAKSTIHAVLCRHGLVKALGRPADTPPARPFRPEKRRMTSGAWISKESSGLATAAIAIRSPSPITPRAFCCFARPWNRPAKSRSSRLSSAFSANAACPAPSAPTTAFPSPAPTASSISPNSPSGGCGSASPSNASSPGARNRTDAMSACI